MGYKRGSRSGGLKRGVRSGSHFGGVFSTYIYTRARKKQN